MKPTINQDDKDDVNKWITKLHFEPEEKVRKFEKSIRSITETFDQLEFVPFENQTSQEITSKLKRISKTLTNTVKELQLLKIYDGQDLKTSPANLPVHYAIDNAYDELCNDNGTASEVAGPSHQKSFAFKDLHAGIVGNRKIGFTPGSF